MNGAKVFVEEEAKRGNTDIKIIGHPNTNNSVATTGGVAAAHPEVSSVLVARSIEQFNFYLPEEGPDSRFKNTIEPGPGGFVPVNTPVENGQKMKLAGLDVVFYTDGIGTDTANQTLVWFPDRKIVMNNVVWGWFPNIYSARGGRYRDPNGWMAALEVVRKLKPEILLSTHSTSLVGNAAIEQRIQDYHDGLAFVLDQSLKGILLGQGPDELRYSVKLPKRLQEFPSWCRTTARSRSWVRASLRRSSANSIETPPRSTSSIRPKKRSAWSRRWVAKSHLSAGAKGLRRWRLSVVLPAC